MTGVLSRFLIWWAIQSWGYEEQIYVRYKCLLDKQQRCVPARQLPIRSIIRL